MQHVKICHECAVDLGIKQQLDLSQTCTRHPNTKQDENHAEYEHYLYDELPAEDMIRLLQVEPGSGGEPINCNLIVTPLDSDTSYTALSYTWGDPFPKHTISCNGSQISIGENLHSALLQFQRDNRMEPFWIDAICINQRNNDEKTCQVRKMREIYQRATQVICWLGEAEGSDEEGFALIRKLHTKYGDLSPVDLLSSNFKTTAELDLPDTENQQWKSMGKILCRPYFYRIWIVQEIIAATRCTIQCGTHIIDRAAIFAIGAIFENFHFVKDAMGSNIPLSPPEDLDDGEDDFVLSYSVQHLWSLQTLLDNHGKQKMFQLLMNTRAFKATNPLDKIFALIGLCSDVDPTFIDYSKSIDEVQIEIAKLGMMNLESWGPMVFSYVDLEYQCKSLPSWVPDWIQAPRMLPLAGSYYPYRLSPAPDPNWEVTSNNKVVLKGRIIGEVTKIIHETPYMTATPRLESIKKLVTYFGKMEDWEESAWAMTVTLEPYTHTDEHISEVFWRTLIFNREGIDKIPDKTFQWAFKTWSTTFDQLKDESLVEMTDRLEQARLQSESTPPATSIFGRAYRFVSSIFTEAQLFPSRVKLLMKVDVATRLMRDGAPYENAFYRYAPGRKLCTTTGGYLGWVPSAAREGDVFCFFEDCQLPFVLRECGDEYQLIGDGYLHGLMQPSATLFFLLAILQERDIILV